MNSNEEVFQMSDFFRILGDTTRLKILIMLVKKEYSVNELTQSLNISQSSVSHQLKILNSNKMVAKKRNGKMIYYKINDVFKDYIEINLSFFQ